MPTVLITGANRGLGLEFVRQYAADGWRVLACVRDPANSGDLARRENVAVHALDVSDFAAIDRLAQSLKGTAIDLLLNNAGVIGPRAAADGDLRQSFGHLDYAILDHVLRVNTLAPLKMAEAFIEHVAASDQKKIVTISSSIGKFDRADGGVYAYRTSKAAVNMAMHNLAADVKTRSIIVANFCPGWVKTRMGGEGAQIEPDVSIGGMRKVIAGLTLEVSGQFWLYDGSSLAW